MTVIIQRPVQEDRPANRVAPYYGNLHDLEQRMQIEYYPIHQEPQLLEIFWDSHLHQAVFSNQQRQLTTVRVLPGMPMTLRRLLWHHHIDTTRIAVDGIQLHHPRGFHLVLDHPIETMADVYQLEIWGFQNHDNNVHG